MTPARRPAGSTQPRATRPRARPRSATATRLVNRGLGALRAEARDPLVQDLGATRALAVRIGFGDGEELAEGRWQQAREIPPPRRGRLDDIDPQSRVASVLAGRDEVHPAETMLERARLDIEQGREHEARLGARGGARGAPRGAGRTRRDNPHPHRGRRAQARRLARLRARPPGLAAADPLEADPDGVDRGGRRSARGARRDARSTRSPSPVSPERITSAAISSAWASAEPAMASAPGSRPRIAPSATRDCSWTWRWISRTSGSPVVSMKNIRGAYGCVST